MGQAPGPQQPREYDWKQDEALQPPARVRLKVPAAACPLPFSPWAQCVDTPARTSKPRPCPPNTHPTATLAQQCSQLQGSHPRENGPEKRLTRAPEAGSGLWGRVFQHLQGGLQGGVLWAVVGTSPSLSPCEMEYRQKRARAGSRVKVRA